MLPKNRPPTHPGEMLLEEILKPLGVSQKEFAVHLGWTYARLNARENPSVARTANDGLYLIEVFPALALPALEPCILKRKRKASYNPDKKAKFSRSDWDLVTEAVRRHADTFNVAPLSRWANEKAKLDTLTKSDQDCLDAAILEILQYCHGRYNTLDTVT